MRLEWWLSGGVGWLGVVGGLSTNALLTWLDLVVVRVWWLAEVGVIFEDGGLTTCLDNAVGILAVVMHQLWTADDTYRQVHYHVYVCFMSPSVVCVCVFKCVCICGPWTWCCESDWLAWLTQQNSQVARADSMEMNMNYSVLVQNGDEHEQWMEDSSMQTWSRKNYHTNYSTQLLLKKKKKSALIFYVTLSGVYVLFVFVICCTSHIQLAINQHPTSREENQ